MTDCELFSVFNEIKRSLQRDARHVWHSRILAGV